MTLISHANPEPPYVLQSWQYARWGDFKERMRHNKNWAPPNWVAITRDELRVSPSPDPARGAGNTHRRPWLRSPSRPAPLQASGPEASAVSQSSSESSAGGTPGPLTTPEASSSFLPSSGLRLTPSHPLNSRAPDHPASPVQAAGAGGRGRSAARAPCLRARETRAWREGDFPRLT